MKLTEEQINVVKNWVRDGAKPADIQKRLAEEWSISMTYMDVRFLVDDLDLSFIDPTPPAPEPEATDEASATPEAEASDEEWNEADPLQPVGQVSVEVNKVTRPGTLVSGSVVFSDGMKAEWGLDQYGRIMLNADREGYQPADEDLQAFQQELSRQLQSQGF